MARLPSPGGDDGTWGEILNEFLGQEHNPDGTQKTLDVSKGGTGATDVTNARTNLGLGTAATRDIGTGANTVAAGDDSRITGALQASDNLAGVASAATALSNLGGASSSDITTLQNKSVPVDGAVMMRDPNLSAWYADLETAYTEPVDLVLITDSIGEYGWINQLHRQLGGLFNGKASTVTAPVQHFKHASPSNFFNRMSTTGGTHNGNGFAGYSATLANGESSQQTSVSCDGVIVVWTAGTGTLTVKDGGSGGTTVATIDTSTGSGASNITSINLGSYSSRTIYIESSGTSILEGIFPTVGNRTAGVRVWRCAHAGYTTYDEVGPPAKIGFGSNTTLALDFISKLKAHTGKEPHVIVGTGFNDAKANYGTYVSDFTDLLRARTDGSIAWWINWGRSGGSGDAEKAAAGRASALAKNCGIIDAFSAFGDIGNNNDPNSMSGDGAHPNTNGTAAIATHALAILSGNPIGVLTSMIAQNTYEFTGNVTGNVTGNLTGGANLDLATNGGVQFGNFFGYPIFAMSANTADANQQIAFYNSGLGAIIGGPAGSPMLLMGPGGATNPDTALTRVAAHTFGISAGGSAPSNQAALGGTLHVNTTAVGNIGTGEDNLMTYAIPASTLGINNERIEFKAAGTIANNANQKRIKVFFGSATILDTGATGLPTSAAIEWEISGEVFRTGATAQKAIVRIVTNNTTFRSTVDYGTASETLSSAVTIKLTGEGTSNNDVVQEVFTVKWLPAK